MARHNFDIYSRPDIEIAAWLLNSLAGYNTNSEHRPSDEQRLVRIIQTIRERTADAVAFDTEVALTRAQS